MKTILVLLFLFLLAGAAFIFSGRYDVSTASHHWPPVKAVISLTMDRSVKHHARDIQVPPNLDDTAQVHTGYGHYQEMCLQCHGAPGVPPGEMARGLYPRAPRLAHAAQEWSPAELFWMTRNGIKMTGMPGFGVTHTDAQIWAIVAFMKKLPTLDSASYAALAKKWGDAIAE